MNLTQFKQHLQQLENPVFMLPDQTNVPLHYHITEAALVNKHFIDCGGTLREEKTITLQIWVANDTDHRLTSGKIVKILNTFEKHFGIHPEMEVELEYQSETIGRYALEGNTDGFQLLSKFTDCLASDHCGIPDSKMKVNMADLGETKSDACCTPGGGCC
ncbi:MAG: DUF6428 family protein [Bacteroidia bacterium]|jgi:hypothetical protein